MDRLILENKLRPPDCRRLLKRGRLLDAVSEEEGARLTAVCADAGYGKTTLLAQILAATEEPYVWYQLDGADRDITVLVLHLAEGISWQQPGFGTWVRQMLRDSAVHADVNDLLSAFVSEFEQKVAAPFSIFLDEFQVIDDHGGTVKAVQFLIDRMPRGVRFFIASRTRPDLPLGRMRASGSLLEIRTDDLKMTPDEMKKFFLRQLPLKVDREEMVRIYASTEGWPVAAALVKNQVDRMTSSGRMPLELKVFSDINEYLEEEVWGGLDEGLKAFLLKCSLPDVVEAEILCEAIGDGMTVAEAENYLESAADANILLWRLGEGNEYRLHNLFADFLKKRLRHSLSREEIRSLHRDFALAYEERGRPDPAITHYIQAGMTDDLARVIEEHGERILESGRIKTLAAWLDQLPAGMVEERSWLCYLKSRVLDRGQLDEISRLTRLAQTGFQKTGDRRGLFLSALAANEIQLTRKGFGNSLSSAREALGWAHTPTEKIMSLYRLGLNNLLMGKPDEAVKVWDGARRLCTGEMLQERVRLETSVLNACFFSGDFRGLLQKSGELYESVGMDFPATVRFVILYWRVMALFEMGQYGAAAELTGKAADYIGMEYRSREISLDCMDGQIMLYNGNSRHGRRSIEEAVSRARSLFILGPENPYNHIGNFERQRRSFERALHWHRLAMEQSRDEKPYTIASCLANVGADKQRLTEGAEGEVELAAAEALATRIQAGYILMQVHFNRAWRALVKGREEKALSEVKESLACASRYRHDHYWSQEGKISLELLAFAFEKGVERAYLTDIFRMIGSRSLSALSPILGSGDAATRKATVVAMAAAGGLSAVPRIQRMLRDPDGGVRAAARLALDEIRSRSAAPRDLLTRREFQVLEMMAEGASNIEIATRLVVTEPTVKSHASSIFRKLAVGSRTQAAMYYNQYRQEEQPDGEEPEPA